MFESIMDTTFVQIILNYHGMLATALAATLQLALISLFFACLLGLLFGILSTVHSRVCNAIAAFYVDAIRGWPLIVLAFFVYFGFPAFMQEVLGLTSFRLSAQNAGIIALSLNCGAYMAEIIRAGIQSVDVGQMEAARSLGMSYGSSMGKVVVPQAIRTMIPSIINQFIITLKDTSILTVIGYPELTNTAKTISANTMRPLETWLIAGLLYMVVIIALSKLSKGVERRINRGR